jgi:hypothetical protein
MLYLIRTDMTTEWLEHFGRKEMALAEANGVTLDGLDWKTAERVADETTLRLALRMGQACGRGVVVDAGDLVPHDRPTRIREAHAAAVAHRPVMRETLEKLEKVYPGRLAEEDASNAEVDAGIAESLGEADATLSVALAVEPQPHLVEHWRSLGGLLPDPL